MTSTRRPTARAVRRATARANRRYAAAFLAAAATIGGLSACGGDDYPRPGCNPAAGALIIGVSVHQNTAAPAIPEGLACLIRATAIDNMPISVVGIDGTPQVDPQMNNRTFQVRTANPSATSQDADRALATVIAVVNSLQADSNGADVIAALGIIRDLAQSRTQADAGDDAPTATAVLLDSMLPDTGPLRLTQPGWAQADPTEVADSLAAAGQLPDAQGIQYQLVGVGYTAPPQQPLTAAMRQNVTDIWSEVLQRGGAADVIADPEPRQGAGPDTSFTTATVPVPDVTLPPICAGSTQVYGATSPLAFERNTAVLRDPDAASTALTDIASWLQANPARRAALVGTTANVGDLPGQIELARSRATTVAQLLQSLGVPQAQLDIDGVGSAFPEYVPDLNDPAAQQANRTVRITLSGPATTC